MSRPRIVHWGLQWVVRVADSGMPSLRTDFAEGGGVII